MVSKTDDIPASVPDCNPVDLADKAGDGAQDGETQLKDPCGETELRIHARYAVLRQHLCGEYYKYR